MRIFRPRENCGALGMQIGNLYMDLFREPFIGAFIQIGKWEQYLLSFESRGWVWAYTSSLLIIMAAEGLCVANNLPVDLERADFFVYWLFHWGFVAQLVTGLIL